MKYLDDLESRIDPEAEKRLYRQWTAYADGTLGESRQTRDIAPRKGVPSSIDWPAITINEALATPEQMLYSQLKQCSDQLAAGGNNFLWMRANYGVGIVPSMLGCPIFYMPPEMNTLPNVRSLAGGEAAIRQLAEGSLPSFSGGWGKDVLAVGAAFAQIREKYPKIAAFVRIDHPDCQGPIDLCELLWGSDLFYAFYDDDALVHRLLDQVTDFYTSFLDHWFALLPRPDSFHSYFRALHKGAVTIRNDSAMNLSPELYGEFIFPYDQRVFRHFGGGMVHFCGTGTHFIAKMAEMEGLYAVDISQPHLNDLEVLLSNTVDRGINLQAPDVPEFEAVIADGGKHNFDRLSLA